MAAQLSGKSLGGPQGRRCREGLVVQASRPLVPAAPAPRGAPATIPRLPRAALPHHTPRGSKPGDRVTRIYRRWCGPPNPPLKPTPLRGPDTPAILRRDLDRRVVPLYHGGAA